MPNLLKTFITELRASSEAKRKLYLVYGSGVTMCLVVALWGVYLNLNVHSIGEDTTAEISQAAPQDSFFSTMGRGSAILYSQFADFIRKEFSKKKEFTIDTQENFQSGDLPTLAPQDIR